MLQNGFIIPQIGFKFDSIKRKKGFNHASYLPQQCLKVGVKPGDSRNETGQQPERNRAATGMKPSIYGKKGLLDQGAKQVRNDQKRPLGARETSRSLRSLRGHYGHYAVTTVTTRSLRSLRGHHADTTRSKRATRSRLRKRSTSLQNGLFDQDIVAVDLEGSDFINASNLIHYTANRFQV